MKKEITKTVILSNLLWKLLERAGTQGIQLVVQIALARLLMPEEYGIIAIIDVFITLSGIFVQSGLNTALIQKKDADEVDFSSVFYLSLVVAGFFYMVLFAAAPPISDFFNEPRIVPVLRILSITLFFSAFNSIQYAVIARNMEFKRLFFSSIAAVAASGATGIGMAFAGYGVWALVGQTITNQLVMIIVLWFTVKWRPKPIFSIAQVGALFSYGWKLMMSSLILMLYHNLRDVVIGKLYKPAMLGFYGMGYKIPALIIININGSIISVLLPALSSFQDDKEKVRKMVRRAIVTSSFIIFPMMVGLAVVAEPLVRTLLTDKWLPSVPFIQLACIAYGFWPMQTANLQAINALGRSDIFLKLEIVKTAIGLSILLIAIPYGVYAIALGGAVSGVIATAVNAYPNKKLLDYSYLQQLRDIMPSLLLALAMGGIVLSIRLLALDPLPTLILQILTGAGVYIALARLLKLECFAYLLETIRDIASARKNAGR